jgi:hypothetical protein
VEIYRYDPNDELIDTVMISLTVHALGRAEEKR